MKKILVTGDRNWVNADLIMGELQYQIRILGIEAIVEGEARGADRMARDAANQLGLRVFPYPAQWDLYGRAAGPIRNQKMLDDNPDIIMVMAFHDDLDNSKGTQDMVRRALAKGLHVICFNSLGSSRSLCGNY